MKLSLPPKVSTYADMLSRWVSMLLGKSYWHLPQGLGKQFVPGELRGYFNDLTHKVEWNGPTDERGLPLNSRGGKRFLFPTTLLQKALGHWDLWLTYQDRSHVREFLKIADWAVETQDEQGGWLLWPLLGLGYSSPYSAMTQGEGISVLARAYAITQDAAYLKAARRALGPMEEPLERGGTCRNVPEGIVLEEVPADEHKAIFNGWVFALFGLYDFLLVERCAEVRKMLDESLSALVAYLPFYDVGYWSYYDLSGNLASPFYHRLHVAQLRALELAFREYDEIFRLMREDWSRQLHDPIARARAIWVKAYQKLRNPPEAVLR